jgi:hypothetical protein
MKQSDIAYYSTIAQMLPVLVIFAAIELRLLKPDLAAPPTFRRIRTVLVAAFCPLALLAEQTCLNALLNDHVSTVFTKEVIFWITMVCVGIVFLAPGIFHIAQLDRERWEQEQSSKDGENPPPSPPN